MVALSGGGGGHSYRAVCFRCGRFEMPRKCEGLGVLCECELDEAGVFGEGLEEGGVAGRPTGGFEPCVRDAFVGPAALAVEIHWAVRGKRFAEALGEVGVQFALSDGMIVYHVEEAAEAVVHRVNHGGSGVVAMDLVDPPVSVALDHCSSVEELS